MPTPSNLEQELFEMVNRARANPQGEYDLIVSNGANQTGVTSEITSALRYFNVDLNLFQQQMTAFGPVAPLAWNSNLNTSADNHNNLMIAQDTQSHYLVGEAGLFDRITAAGYTNGRRVAENIYAFSYSPLYAHAGFMIDWGAGPGGIQDPAGHRNVILSSNYQEIGISIVKENNPSTSVGPQVVTQHFGSAYNYTPQLLGVVIEDQDGDDFYDAGEGLGGVTVTIRGVGSTTGTYTTTTWASGGYQISVAAGTYEVEFSGGSLNGTVTRTFTMGSNNVKIDAQASDALTNATGPESLYGDGSANALNGLDGNDTLYGLSGNDTLIGGAGNDSIFGGDGNDRILDGSGSNRADGGAGNDYLLFLRGQNQIEGGDGSDVVVGGFQRDVLSGGAGNDIIRGEPISNFLGGGDELIGGTGNDILMGGRGADEFIFNPNDGSDTIASFDLADVTLGANGYSVSARSADFEINVDHIVLDGFSGISSANVMSYVSVSGGTTRFSAQGTTITLYGVTGVDADDFMFL